MARCPCASDFEHLSITQTDEKYEGILDCESVGDDVLVKFLEKRFTVSVHHSPHEKGQIASIFTAQGATKLVVIDPFLQRAEGVVLGGRLTAPMPGKMVSFAVKAGDAVKAGQTLAVMEAMKMEHTIAAPRDGVVSEILYAVGDQVGDGAELIQLALT
jgi:3-methylcrotonyl-CoA carboxylase alpha subunit